MRNLLKSRKAQFYILSVVAIVGVMYFLSRWMEPSQVTDTSDIVLLEEPFIFNNIKEKSMDVVRLSKNCDELGYNLQEYKQYIGSFALEKNILMNFTYSYPSCISGMYVDFKLKLTSTRTVLASNYSVQWVS